MTQQTVAASTDTGILLESGTNELEILVFQIGTGSYGINVAKVREVVPPVKVVATPQRPKMVMGMFNLRGHLMPLVDLAGCLNLQPASDDPKSKRVIVAEFNNFRSGFIVDRVERIHRMSWADMRPASGSEYTQTNAVTGIIQINDRLILMLDFESVVDHISMQRGLHVEQVENETHADRANSRIWIVEDSQLVRGLVQSTLVNSGYTRIRAFSDGLQAWNAIESSVETGDLPDLVLTDIEMPQMDGLALTKSIKSHPQLKHIPVILFSSLITPDTTHKGKQVGADDQISKPDVAQVVHLIDRWVLKRRQPPQAPESGDTVSEIE